MLEWGQLASLGVGLAAPAGLLATSCAICHLGKWKWLPLPSCPHCLDAVCEMLQSYGKALAGRFAYAWLRFACAGKSFIVCIVHACRLCMHTDVPRASVGGCAAAY